MTPAAPRVSIVIPVYNKLEYTRLCLDRLERHTQDVEYEVIVVDNASSDGTPEWFTGRTFPMPLRYERSDVNLGFARANNRGVALSFGPNLLFLNNDTLVEPGWLSAMLRVMTADPRVGIVGIKQLFPYTSSVYHTGIVFDDDGMPQHLYPHLPADLPKVNQERQYQAVNGACLLISRALFDACGGFDEAYVNGYEDTDLCLKVIASKRTIVCCVSAFIYHYAQTSEGRTADDGANAALFASRWRTRVRPDQTARLIEDRLLPVPPSAPTGRRTLPVDAVYLADPLDQASSLTWVNVDLALALLDLGIPAFVRADRLSPTIPAAVRRRLQPMALTDAPLGGAQIKWSHYWDRHLGLELNGDVNCELFVINYQFGRPGSEPWDYWSQVIRGSGRHLLPSSAFCSDVLGQIGVAAGRRTVLHLGYAPESQHVETAGRRDGRFRFLTVTNSHDVHRYGTLETIDAFAQAFVGRSDVVLVVKDYGASSGVTTVRDRVAAVSGAAVEYLPDFTDKADLMRLYKSSDAFVSAHRGEGFGMKILDAMACGVPVLTTLFGGPTAYCTAENTWPIDFSLVPVTQGLDAAGVPLVNQPLWAEPSVPSIAARMREVFERRDEAARRAQAAQAAVLDAFSWPAVGGRLLDIVQQQRDSHGRDRLPVLPRVRHTPAAIGSSSPYWLGTRVSVIIPTHNRKAQLVRCLDALSNQSVLPQEFEVIVIDDGSTDETAATISDSRWPFALTFVRQEPAGPAAARNRAIDLATGEFILFIGDDIYADRRLIEEHLRAHAGHGEPGAAVLGHIDWPAEWTPNAVMDYVTGEGMRQFAYPLIATLPVLDHRFFYTSNLSLRRQFLVDAAAAGVRFDTGFSRAAFEDSEFALRLRPRGLVIHYAAAARAVHDHWMDLESFARRERGAGAMAVVFFRKHPNQDEQLQVRRVAAFVGPAAALLHEPALLAQFEGFDRHSDSLLRALAGSLEELLALSTNPHALPESVSPARTRAALANVYATVFDVERSRGMLEEWCAGSEAAALQGAAQTLAAVTRKVAFLTTDGAQTLPGGGPLDAATVAALRGRLATLPGMPSERVSAPSGGVRQVAKQWLRRPGVIRRLVAADRFVEQHLQGRRSRRWLTGYRELRWRVRTLLSR